MVRNKEVPRHAQHHCQDPLLKHPFPEFFLFQVCVDPDDLDHVPTQDREVLLVHRLHAIRPQEQSR